jgi:hypothetical protein
VTPRTVGGALWVLTLAGTAMPATAQWREGQPPVVTPEARPVPPPPADVVAPFARAYRAAGRPRVVLMWNRPFSDESATATVHRKVTRDTATAKTGGSTQTTTGSAGSASMSETTRDHDRTRVETAGTVAMRETARRTALPEREFTMLERAFVSAMARGSMRFIDRALVMRTTAAAQHRGGGDQQLIETDALLKHGDLIMEVLLVEDRDAPLGYAFDVRTKDLRQGLSISTLYSHALPHRPPQGTGSWQPGAQGYEFRQPPQPPPPSIVEIGDALARDVMIELGAAWRK